MNRTIIHIDMDAFFASVEQVDFPEYAGRPLVVGADPRNGNGRGVVSAASYEARTFGIHSAQPISKAFKLCPHAVFVRPRMKRYSAVSKIVMNILHCFTPLVEQISIDEAFMDCTASLKLFGGPLDIAEKIKKEIYSITQLTASIGVASNKSIAKIASDLKKPNGVTCCLPGQEKEFLADLDISRLWGAGKKTVSFLNTLGFYKIGDLADKAEGDLHRLLGKNGTHLWQLANGIDLREVIADTAPQKSIGREHTFLQDTTDRDLISKQIICICDTITREMRSVAFIAKTVSLKVRLQDFETCTRNFSFTVAVGSFVLIKNKALELFSGFDTRGKAVRLIGVSLSNFYMENEGDQLVLFEDATSKVIDKSKKNDQLLDTLKDRYGEKITRATLLD